MVQLEYGIVNSHVSSNSIQQKLAVYLLHVKNCAEINTGNIVMNVVPTPQFREFCIKMVFVFVLFKRP